MAACHRITLRSYAPFVYCSTLFPNKNVDVQTMIAIRFYRPNDFCLYILLHPLSRIMSRRTGFAGWKLTSNHINYCRVLNLHRSDSPCIGDLQSTSRSERRRTYLVSSLQMTLTKACSNTEIFPRLPRGSNPWPLVLKASALTTRLPRFHGCKNCCKYDWKIHTKMHQNHWKFECPLF